MPTTLTNDSELSDKLSFAAERAFEGVSYEEAGKLMDLIVPFAECLVAGVKTPTPTPTSKKDLDTSL